jgi:hypothetical protein
MAMARVSNVAMPGGILGRFMAVASMGLSGCGAAPPSAGAPEHGLPLLVPKAAPLAPGQSIYLVARMIPEHGEVTAQTKDYPELAARRSARIDACLAARLGTRIYEPFRVGSDVICDPAPAPRERKPGDPAPWTPPRRAGCSNPEEATTKISYPLPVDRRENAPR